MKLFVAIFLGLAFSLGISGGVSYGIVRHFGMSSWMVLAIMPWFLLLLRGIQSVFETINESIQIRAVAEAEAEKTKNLRVSGLVCYKCRNANMAILNPFKPSVFTCEFCGAKNKVIVAHKCIHPAEEYNTFNLDKDILAGDISDDAI